MPSQVDRSTNSGTHAHKSRMGGNLLGWYAGMHRRRHHAPWTSSYVAWEVKLLIGE